MEATAGPKLRVRPLYLLPRCPHVGEIWAGRCLENTPRGNNSSERVGSKVKQTSTVNSSPDGDCLRQNLPRHTQKKMKEKSPDSSFGFVLQPSPCSVWCVLRTLIEDLVVTSASEAQTLLMQLSTACKALVKSCSHQSFSAALNFPPRSQLGFSAASTSIAGILKCFRFLAVSLSGCVRACMCACVCIPV